MNHELDLSIHRVIRASRAAIWDAWTKPELFQQWFLPQPATLRIEQFEPVPGGALVTSMAEPEGEWIPHVDGCFLAVEPLERLVYTNAIDSAYRPREASKLRMSAEILLEDHADGTMYRAIVRHANEADREEHERLGFAAGWGTVTAQLADLVE